MQIFALMKLMFLTMLALRVLFGLPPAAFAAPGNAFDESAFTRVVVSGSLEELEAYIARHKDAIEPWQFSLPLSTALDTQRADVLERPGKLRLLLKSGASSDLSLPLQSCSSPELLKIFLEEGAEVHLKGGDYLSPLFEVQLSSPRGPCYPLEHTALLLEAGADPNAPAHKSNTPLTRAISHYRYNAGKDFNLPLAQMLLKAGADPNYGPTPDETPLTISIDHMRKDILILLLESGADPSYGNPLSNALHHGMDEYADILLRHGASLEGDAGGKCLRSAAAGSSPAMVRKLLDAGVDPRLRDALGYTALDRALERKGLLGRQTSKGKEISAILRKAGAVSLLERHERLYETARTGGLDEFSALLIDKDTCITQKLLLDTLHQALQASKKRDRREIIALLLEKGANKDIRHPLQENVSPEILRLYLDAGAEARPEEGSPPLFFIHWDTPNGIALARMLLDAGADPNATMEPGPSLDIGVAELAKGTPLVILALPFIEAGERKNVPSAPLLYAVTNGDPVAVNLLLDRGATVGVKNQYGWDALFYALHFGKEENVSVLLARGAVPDGADILEKAVRRCPDSLRALLAKGANAKGDSGYNALRAAVKEGSPETVELLIKAGADIHRRDKNGQSLLELAQGRKSYLVFSSSDGEAVKKLLRKAGLSGNAD